MSEIHDTATEVKKRRQPTPKEWAEMEALWELGEISRPEIAKKLGISPTAVSIHMKKRGVKRGSKQEEQRRRISGKIMEKVSSHATIHAQRIQETKDQHYQIAQSLTQLAWAKIVKTQKSGDSLSSIHDELKAIECATNTMAKLRNERWQILGLDKDAVDQSELPELVVAELTADQIEEMISQEDDLNYDFDDEDENQQINNKNINKLD